MKSNKFNHHAKTVGIIGLLIPVFFIVGFLVFFFKIFPNAIEYINQLTITSYNIKGIPGQNWIAYFVYQFVGFSIVVFCLGMILTTKNNIVDMITKILLLISGLSWMILGFYEHNPATMGDDIGLAINIMCTFFTLFFGLIAFILFAFGDDFSRKGEKNILKWLLLVIALFIIIESSFAMLMSDYPLVFSYSSWLAYFLGFAILGIGLIRKNHYYSNESILDYNLN